MSRREANNKGEPQASGAEERVPINLLRLDIISATRPDPRPLLPKEVIMP
jgi:hypothetical protein